MKKVVLLLATMLASTIHASDLNFQESQKVRDNMTEALRRHRLAYAIDSKNISEIRRLIPLVGVGRSHGDSKPLLHRAVETGDSYIVQLFINAGAPVLERDSYGRTALAYAEELGNPVIIQLLVEALKSGLNRQF